MLIFFVFIKQKDIAFAINELATFLRSMFLINSRAVKVAINLEAFSCFVDIFNSKNGKDITQ